MPKVNRHYLKSFARIVEDEAAAEEFFKLFYSNFMAQSAEIRYKFRNTEWSRQITLLKNMLLYLQRYYETGVANERLQELAKTHSRREYDIAPELYELWLNAFLKTLREADPKWSKAVEAAWVEVLSPGIEYMSSRY